MLAADPSAGVPEWRSIISTAFPINRASSNTLIPAASASEANAERRS
ncbi:MAG: hypothetical protein ABSH51_26080 [Solirubrobacteraceae bacterium]|jgi:hypothetical protein